MGVTSINQQVQSPELQNIQNQQNQQIPAQRIAVIAEHAIAPNQQVQRPELQNIHNPLQLLAVATGRDLAVTIGRAGVLTLRAYQQIAVTSARGTANIVTDRRFAPMLLPIAMPGQNQR